jgi:thioredoxin 1
MSQFVQEFKESTFEEDVINSSQPVMVDFWAEWCGPCRALAPTVEEIGQQYAGRVKVGKVNVDQNPSLSGRFGIRGIPTLLIFKGGKVVEQIVGLVGKQQIAGVLDKVLG